LIGSSENRVIFDMTGVTHMDSAAIGALVRCLTKLKRAGGGLRMAGAQPMVDYSLKLTKLDKLIPNFKSVGEAATGFSSSAQA
jgi:anti-sigma B factor antagonist